MKGETFTDRRRCFKVVTYTTHGVDIDIGDFKIVTYTTHGIDINTGHGEYHSTYQ